MVGALMQSTTFPSTLSSERNVCSKQFGNKKRQTIKMMCSLQPPPMRVRTFSGLRGGVNALDNMVNNKSHDFHSTVAPATLLWREKDCDILPKGDMFEHFTEKAIEAIIFAQEEARWLGHNDVGSELILLGIIGEGTSIAAKLLISMGVNYESAYAEVKKIIGRSSGFVSVEIPFTPRAEHVIIRSSELARELGHYYIGPEHLLLGLLHECDGVAVRVLDSLGANRFDILQQVINMVNESAEAVGTGVGNGSFDDKMPTLENYGTNLTKLAAKGKLDPVVERQPEIEGKKVLNVDMGLLGGELEERLKKLIKLTDEIILIIDEVHTLMGVRVGEGAIDAA